MKLSNNIQYVKGNRVWLKDHPEFDEAWLRDVIANDPSILGLGDLVMKETERMQPKAGRLDILLQDSEIDKRYEVEIMLGRVDESHIIRCIEYWDIERKRFPNYDHCAVLVAEEITSRFLNVISLFNGVIPMIALQMTAIQIDNKVLLNFAKVLDEVSLGTAEEEEELSEREITDRAYWEVRGSPLSMKLLDESLDILKEINPDLSFKYNKYYVGLAQKNRPNIFVIFRAKKKFLRVEIRVADLDALKEKFNSTEIEVLRVDKRWGRLLFTLNKGDVEQNKAFLKEIFSASYKESIE
jgi:hypothetical protein